MKTQENWYDKFIPSSIKPYLFIREKLKDKNEETYKNSKGFFVKLVKFLFIVFIIFPLIAGILFFIVNLQTAR